MWSVFNTSFFLGDLISFSPCWNAIRMPLLNSDSYSIYETLRHFRKHILFISVSFLCRYSIILKSVSMCLDIFEDYFSSIFMFCTIYCNNASSTIILLNLNIIKCSQQINVTLKFHWTNKVSLTMIGWVIDWLFY